MDGRSARRVFLGVQWGAGSWDDAALWCDALLGRTGKAPLCWILPCPPAAGRGAPAAGILSTIAGRLGPGGDTLAAAGFAGACQPLLSLDELDREISWCRRNPWGTGLAELLGTSPRILVPRLPDLRRPAALEACGRNGFLQVGTESEGPFRRWPAGSGVQGFSVRRIAAGQPGAARKPPAPRGDLFLVLDLDGLSSPRALESVIDAAVAPFLPFAARFPDDPGPLDAHAGPPGRAPSPGPDACRNIFPAPLARERLEMAAPLSRKRRKKADEYRRLFALLSPGQVEEADAAMPEPRGGPGDRVPVAHMLGEVTLAGSGFDVRIAGGRFLGLASGGTPLVPMRRAASYLRVAGRTHPFRTRGSFSFETAGGTGLREELLLEGTGGQQSTLSVEYGFEEASPVLSIHAEVAWPRLDEAAPVEECVPLSMVVREVPGRAAEVRAEAPDGSQAQYVVREEDGWVCVPGMRQEVELAGGGVLVLRWAEEGARRWGLPFFRVSRCLGRRRGLELSPFGAAPGMTGRWLSARRETFRLLLGVERGE